MNREQLRNFIGQQCVSVALSDFGSSQNASLREK
jgi:hypothetical protein